MFNSCVQHVQNARKEVRPDQRKHHCNPCDQQAILESKYESSRISSEDEVEQQMHS